MNIFRLLLLSMVTVICVVMGNQGYYSSAGMQMYSGFYQNPQNLYPYKPGVAQVNFPAANKPIYGNNGRYMPPGTYNGMPGGYINGGAHKGFSAPDPEYGLHDPKSEYDLLGAHGGYDAYDHAGYGFDKYGAHDPKPRYGFPGAYGGYGLPLPGFGYGYGYGYGLPAKSGGKFGKLLMGIGALSLLFGVFMLFSHLSHKDSGHDSKSGQGTSYGSPLIVGAPAVHHQQHQQHILLQQQQPAQQHQEQQQLPIIIITGPGTGGAGGGAGGGVVVIDTDSLETEDD